MNNRDDQYAKVEQIVIAFPITGRFSINFDGKLQNIYPKEYIIHCNQEIWYDVAQGCGLQGNRYGIEKYCSNHKPVEYRTLKRNNRIIIMILVFADLLSSETKKSNML